MLYSLLCCFRPKNIFPSHSPSPISLPEISQKNIDQTPKNYLTLFDTKSLYDSSKMINNLDPNEKIDWKDTIQFVPPIEKGVVIKVYDGDTITIASKLPYPASPLYRFSVRLNGLDCPEIKGKDEDEIYCAQLAKQEICNLALNKVVTLRNIQTEKYGRILADVYIADLHLNKYMLEKRLAVSYDGGTKISPSNWLNYYSKGEM